MKQLRDYIQKNIVQNILVKYQRKYKTQGFKISFPRGIKLKRNLIITVAISLVLILFAGNFLVKSLSIRVIKDEEDLSTLEKKNFDDSRYNVVLLGFNDLNPVSEYRFLDYVIQVKVDSRKSDIRLFAVNPYILVPKGRSEITLSSFINNIDDKSVKFSELLAAISKLTTQPIDRYLSFNYSDLGNITRLLGLDHRVSESLKSGDKYYAEGSFVFGEDLGDFFSLSQGDVVATNLEEKISFFESFHLSLKNPFKIFSLLDASSELTNLVKTDMTASEFKKFMNDVANGEILRTGYTDTEEYFQIPKNYEDGFKVSDVILDEKLSRIFSRIEILSEQAKIEVYNASDISGLAYNYKRTLENQGSIVVKTGNYPEKVEQNTLYVPNSNRDNFIETINLINNTLNGDVTIISGDYKYNYSGDLILVITK